jgi:hypothetical protein
VKDVFFKNYKWFVTGLWLVLLLTVFIQFTDVCPFKEAAVFVVAFFAVSYPSATFLSKYLLPKALKSENMKVFVFQFIVLTLLLAFFYALFVKGFIWLEMQEVFPRSALFSGTNRPFYAEYFGNLLSAFIANVAFCTLRFFEEHGKMAQAHAKLQQVHLEDELHLLRAQINPHMMFNVLNHIHILMKKNVDKADDLLMRYSDILRYQLYECNREIVSLQKETDYLKDVVEVEKMRWGNELKVDCSWNIENGKTEINPLLLIPFIENAFKHVSRLPSETGYVTIALNQDGDTLRLVVENSRTNQALQKKSASGLGLENVKKRLEILYPGKHKLAVQKTDTVYKITLVITL